MSPAKIAKDCAMAAQSCFSYYCGCERKLSPEAIQAIIGIVTSENPSQGEQHTAYSRHYKNYVKENT